MDNTVGAVGFLPMLVPTALHPIALVKSDEQGQLVRGEDGFCIRCQPSEYTHMAIRYHMVSHLIRTHRYNVHYRTLVDSDDLMMSKGSSPAERTASAVYLLIRRLLHCITKNDHL